MARYDADGDLTCAVQVEVSDYGIGIDAARAADGSFVTTGDFDGDARFGAGGPVLSTVGEGDDGYLATWAF